MKSLARTPSPVGLSLSLLASGLALVACASPSAGDSSSVSDAGSESSESGDTDGPGDPDYSEAGPFTVGNLRFEIPAEAGPRNLPVELWYPSDADAQDATGQITDFVVDPAYAQPFADLVAAAPPACTVSQTGSVQGAGLAAADEATGVETALALIVFSHCHACSRYSTFSVAERLASHGFVVAAVDHVDNTILDHIDGDVVGVSGEFLQTRGADMRALIDTMLSGASPLPEPFFGRIDASRVGVYGHSFGAATAGLVLQDDDRVLAGAAIGAPVDSPLLPGVSVAEIDDPLLFLLATEDNSITEIGNNIIRNNFADLASSSWLVEVIDAGHWSFTDICAVDDIFTAGCGDGERQTVPGEAFTYLDNATARDLTADYVTAFFALQILGDESARAILDEAHPSGATTVEMHD